LPEEVINIINLDTSADSHSLNSNCTSSFIQRSREERIISIVRQSKQMGFATRFWEGDTFRGNFIDARIGVAKSFKKIVRWAKENNFERVTIGEDDLLFSHPDAWKYYIDSIPQDYDIYYGGIYDGEIVDGRIMKGYAGHTLITVNRRVYDFFLTADENFHLDRWLGKHCIEKKYIVCEPFVVNQISDGYSDNHKAMVAHSSFLETMKLFGRQ
jgi:hypothetical protein